MPVARFLEVWNLLFAAVLAPLGLYLLILGWINRQPRPVLVSGTLDFVGVIFAVSGFLLLGGPAILTSLHERWRTLWLLGEVGNVTDGLTQASRIYLLVAVGYLVLLILVFGLTLWQRRRLTVIYNVDLETVEEALESVSRTLGLEMVRSGPTYVFGLFDSPEKTVLHLESFVLLKHVTLRWDAPTAAIRPQVEAELDRYLQHSLSPDHETGLWLTLMGSTLLGVSGMVALVLLFRLFYLR